MDSNKVHKNILKFAMEEISFAEFQDMLFSSTFQNPIRVEWETNGTTGGGPHKDYYWMYWDSSAYVGGDAGGSATKEIEGMVNIKVIGLGGNWRTLDYSSVSKCRYMNRSYFVR